MKKFMMTLAAVLCCAMTTAVFTSCGGDDSGGGSGQPTIVGYQVNYSLEFPKEKELSAGLNGNLFRLCTKIEVGYPDENGKEQKETINNWTWSKTVTYKSLDGVLKLYVTYPESIDEASLTYDYYSRIVTMSPSQANMLQNVKVIYSDGTKKDLNTECTFNLYFHPVPGTQFPKDKIQDFLKKYPTLEESLVDIQFSI